MGTIPYGAISKDAKLDCPLDVKAFAAKAKAMLIEETAKENADAPYRDDNGYLVIPPSTSLKTYEDIRTLASRITFLYADYYNESGRLKASKLVEIFQGRVIVDYSDEVFHAYSSSDILFYVSPQQSQRRKRFQKINALSAYILQYIATQRTGALCLAHEAREEKGDIRANVLANTLLLPSNRFITSYTANSDAWLLSSIFNVSPAMIETRIEVLGLR